MSHNGCSSSPPLPPRGGSAGGRRGCRAALGAGGTGPAACCQQSFFTQQKVGSVAASTKAGTGLQMVQRGPCCCRRCCRRPGRQQAAVAATPPAMPKSFLAFNYMFVASQRPSRRTARPGRPCGARFGPSPDPSPRLKVVFELTKTELNALGVLRRAPGPMSAPTVPTFHSVGLNALEHLKVHFQLALGLKF